MKRAVLLILSAMSALVSEPTLQKSADAVLQAEDSSSGRQLVGTWRLIARVVSLEDGTAVQDPGLGKTPTGYLIYDSSGHMAAQIMKLDRPLQLIVAHRAPLQAITASRSTDTTHTLEPTP